MKNGCPQCEQLQDDELCIDCQMGMFAAELLSIQNKIIDLQIKIKDLDSAIDFWDEQCVISMRKIDLFKQMKKEKHELSNSTSKSGIC